MDDVVIEEERQLDGKEYEASNELNAEDTLPNSEVQLHLEHATGFTNAGVEGEPEILTVNQIAYLLDCD